MGASMSVADLNRRYQIPGLAEIVVGKNGMPAVRVHTSVCTGEIYLHAAHVTAWRPTGQDEVIFVSQKSKFEDGKAIRGGVPICCPWFGNKADDPKAPAHGLVRSKTWDLVSVERSGDDVIVSMATASDPTTHALWPHEFRLLHRVTFGPALRLELVMTNTGAEPFRFEAALHTYYQVGDISQLKIRGLDGHTYIDKTDGNRRKPRTGDIVITGETDSVYQNASGEVEVLDPKMCRRIVVSKQGSMTTVVWNPWQEKTKAMSDLGDDEWKQMVCIEAANAGEQAVELAAGSSHMMVAKTQVLPLAR